MVLSASAEIHNNFLGLLDVQNQVIVADARCCSSVLYSVSSLLMRPSTVMTSANLTVRFDGKEEKQLCMEESVFLSVFLFFCH